MLRGKCLDAGILRVLFGLDASRLGTLHGRRIALLGLSFKPGTDDMREASSIVLAQRLAAEGVELVVHDPAVDERAIERLPAGTQRADTVGEALRDADAAVIVTEWPEYRTVLDAGTAALMRHRLLVDGRNLLDPVLAAEAGYEWIGIGRAASAVTTSDLSLT